MLKKENENMNKRYNKQALMAICVVLMLTPLFTTPVLACKTRGGTYDSAGHYTRYVGQLGGAPYEILMPDDWNGQFVIGCKGYTTSNTDPVPTMESLSTHTIGLMFMTDPALVTANGRFAYAQSTYGVIGFCMKEGMLRTQQLTDYIIGRYLIRSFFSPRHQSGQVYLIGLSMGGQIADMLVDKYPRLYAGVLDICGNKDTAAFYNYWKDLANQPDVASMRTYLLGSPTSLPAPFVSMVPDSALLQMKTSALQVMADVEAEFHGTPESNPRAYDRLSPTCHADIRVPTLSLVARCDMLVPIQHFNAYYDAVKAAGCLSNYRCYTIAGAQHCDAVNIVPKVPTYFMELFNWANGIEIPAPTPKPLP
jgi:hypothetical protein